MKKAGKIFLVLASCVTAFLLYVQFTYDQRFEAPLTHIHASKDSSIIARGKYLVKGPTHCWACHAPATAEEKLSAKHMDTDMMGGVAFDLPIATFYAPNITPDKETGIGDKTDEQLARAIRFGISHDNQALAPFMELQAMNDDDLTAIISYLRTTKPVHHEVPERKLNIAGKIVARYMLKPNFSPPVESPLKPDSTALYGKYLVNALANCKACHTSRDKVTGQFTSPPLSGGSVWETEHGTFTAPNLTPDDTTGWITHWTEKQFVKRFQLGEIIPHGPMPWRAYATLEERDIRAIYKYLKTLEPVRHPLDNPFVLPAKEK